MNYHIKFMTSTDFEKAQRDYDTVVIPVGATEGYGPHMPLGSDIIVAQEVAKALAEKSYSLVGPSLEVGESYSLSLYPGTLYLRPETYTSVIEDFFTSLMNWGFKNFIFINGHAGNVPIIGQVARPLEREHGIRVAQIDWWRFTQGVSKGICKYDGWMAHGHASECGTSVMLYLHPELVKMERAASVTPKEGDDFGKYDDIIDYTVFNKTTESGILGDATIATAEKGEKIFKLAIKRILDYMESKEMGRKR